MDLDLTGKVAVVTGSGRGIGRAIVTAFATSGATVVINAIHEEHVAQVVNEVGSLGSKAVAATADISTERGITDLFDIVEKLGRLDILVNNAGTNIVAPAVDLSEEAWDKVNAVNLRSVFLCSRSAVRRFMIPQMHGKIINISSIAGITPSPNRAPYAVTKAGVIMMTKELSLEWAKYNINVNCIAPGFFLTDMLRARIKEGAINEKAILKRVPLGRFGDLEDIANLALFLSSEDSNYITGQTISVDGGYSVYGAPE